MILYLFLTKGTRDFLVVVVALSYSILWCKIFLTIPNSHTHFIKAYEDLLKEEASESKLVEQATNKTGQAHQVIPNKLLQAIFDQAANATEAAPPISAPIVAPSPMDVNFAAMMQSNNATQ